MGGNAFQQAQKLTPEQYQQIIHSLTQRLWPLCLNIQPYIPFPEKQIHGDVDFLVLLKPEYTIMSIIEMLKLNKGQYIVNNNNTANTIINKKQVDFNVTQNFEEFLRCRFYKSYGGLGSFLGFFFPSKFVKLNQQGLICMAYKQHVKLQFNVCSNVKQIVQFYGLCYESYQVGFKTRIELFKFLKKCKHLNAQELRNINLKNQTKLMKFFQQELIKQEAYVNEFYQKIQNPLVHVLKHFQKQNQFSQAWNSRLEVQQRQKNRANKWNGQHIMKLFDIPSKNVNELKKKFQSSFQSKASYQKYIQQNVITCIAHHFAKVCQIKLNLVVLDSMEQKQTQ